MPRGRFFRPDRHCMHGKRKGRKKRTKRDDDFLSFFLRDPLTNKTVTVLGSKTGSAVMGTIRKQTVGISRYKKKGGYITPSCSMTQNTDVFQLEPFISPCRCFSVRMNCWKISPQDQKVQHKDQTDMSCSHWNCCLSIRLLQFSVYQTCYFSPYIDLILSHIPA